MSIHDYKPAKAEVVFKGGSFAVRGLALDDVAVLMRSHLTDLNALMNIYDSTGSDAVKTNAMAKYALKLVQEAPGLVANLIAIAADEPNEVDLFRALSMPLQLRAIEKIGELTFVEAGGPKNFIESLINLFRVIKPNA